MMFWKVASLSCVELGRRYFEASPVGVCVCARHTLPFMVSNTTAHAHTVSEKLLQLFSKRLYVNAVKREDIDAKKAWNSAWVLLVCPI